MIEHYTEDITASESARKLYADSVSNAVAVMRVAAKLRREQLVTPALMARRRDEYREEYMKLLGIDVCRDVFGSGIPDAKTERVGEDELCEIERVRFKLCDGVYFTGLILWPRRRAAKAPLAIMSHGGGGSPELCSDLIGNNNYGGVVRRILARGVVVFAPQLLLWNYRPAPPGSPIPQFYTPYDRKQTDNELKQLGASIAGFEIYEISRALDWLLADSRISPERCGMLGLSYGGFYTLYTMAYDTRIKSGWSAAFFNDRMKYCWVDFVWADSAGRFLDAEVAGLCAPRRLWVDMGLEDAVFTPDGITPELLERARSFYDAAGVPNQLKLNLWQGGHRFSDSDEVSSGAMDFFLEGFEAYV